MTGQPMIEATLWAVALLPAVVGSALCLVLPRSRAAVALSVSTAAVVTALAVVVAVQRTSVSVAFVAGMPFSLAVDALSAVVLVTVAVVALLVLIFASADVTEAPARFHGLMLLFLAAVVVTATATNLLTLLVAWEVMGATSYALIGFGWRDSEKVDSGAVAFVTTRAADLGLYLAAGAALSGGAGLGLAQLDEAAPGWRHVIAAGVLVAALGKAAQLPFSFWLSRAMAGPSAVSALLHSAAMVAMGGYLLLRVSDLLQTTGWAAATVAWAGALTALLLGAVAVAQSDLKQLLAASTSAQLGFVALAAGVGAVAGGTAHFVAHAATKALLFLLAGAWLTALGTKHLPSLRGAGRRWPGLGITAAVGTLALAGVAPLSMWATKDEVLAAAREQSLALYVVGLGAATLSAAYAGKVLVVVLARVPSDDAVDGRSVREAAARSASAVYSPGSRRVATSTWLALPPLALGAATLGLLALPPVGYWLRETLGDTGSSTATVAELLVSAVLGSSTATVAELLVSAVLAVAVVASMALLHRRSEATATQSTTAVPAGRASVVGWVARWFAVEPLVRRGLVAPTFWAARWLAAFDDRVLDRAVDGCARLTVAVASRLGAFDVRGVDGFVEWIARGIRRLGEYARRSQTGQLHEYYVQATAVLAVGVIVLIVIG